jgi:thiosulfate/3-mercaptopyruvate sulfurtransferase
VARTRLLTETGELEARLGEPGLRILDCSATVEIAATGVRFSSGREEWAREHVPQSGFLDLIEELSAPHPRLHFMLPAAASFAATMSAHGVGEGTRVVLYDRHNGAWAARVFWMLAAYGFDRATLLDGGLTKWKLEGRPLSSGPEPEHPPASFAPRPREGVFVGRDAVLAGIGETDTCLLNGLAPALHSGSAPTPPGRRPGHIPRSRNVPADRLVDASTRAFLPDQDLRAILEEAGALQAGRVITYCGGGIAASGVAFALRLLGHEDVAIYDASLEEWAADPRLPLEVG